MRSLSLSSVLFSAFAFSLQLSAQSEPEVPKAPVTIEPGLEKALEWRWWVVASDSVKNWANPTPPPTGTATGENGTAVPGAAAAEPRPREYVVQRGNVLARIGRRYGVTAQQLKEFNGLTKDMIQIGQVLKIPTIEEVMAMTPPPPAKEEKKQEQANTEAKVEDARAPVLPPGQEDLLMQIYLDREGYSCGSIDGNAGPVFSKILQLYRDNHPEFIDMTSLKEKAMEVVGQPLTGYTLKPEDLRFIAKPAPSSATPIRRKGSGSGSKSAPKDEIEPATTYEELTSAPMLLYRNPWEFVAERFHCDEVFLRNLNPRIKNPEAGTGFQVPNVIPFEIEKAFEGTLQPEADPANPVSVAVVELSRLEVSRGGKVIAVAPVGFARPGLRGAGSWTIHQAIPLPKLATLQELKEDPKPAATVLIQTDNNAAPPEGSGAGSPAPSAVTPTVSKAALASEQFLAEGPNNPVGLVWLNLSKTKTKEALPYGLHGTSIPRRMKSQEGIGGIRLTNWDVMRIVRLIPAGTQMFWK